MDMEVFLLKERNIPGARKIGAPISCPRIADKKFTGTRIFLRIILRNYFPKNVMSISAPNLLLGMCIDLINFQGHGNSSKFLRAARLQNEVCTK